LLTRIAPRVAVVSAGFANRFRMPHGEVLARYAGHGIVPWRTDVHGAVVVTANATGALAVRASRP
jgi:competence protein ComEC